MTFINGTKEHEVKYEDKNHVVNKTNQTDSIFGIDPVSTIKRLHEAMGRGIRLNFKGNGNSAPFHPRHIRLTSTDAHKRTLCVVIKR